MLRMLSHAGHRVIAFTNSKKAVGYHSKYGERIIFSSIKNLKDQILDITKQFPAKIDCIITSGVLLAQILADYPELYEICNVQSGPYSLIKVLAHKNQMYEYASARGLNCAKYVLLSDYQSGDLRFPVILKRNYEINLFFKVKTINTEQELFHFINKIDKEKHKHILVQEFINLDSFINISFQGYLINGNLKCYFICDQVRRLSSGITSYIEEINDKEICNFVLYEANAFFNHSDYTGFTEIEFLYSKTEKELYFIEINTRTCGLHSVLKTKFLNLSDLYNDIHNPPELMESPKLVSWVNIVRDIKARWQGKDLKNLSQFITAEHDIFDWHDLKPFIFNIFKYQLS
jgi:predicted ATP-grasp superfamily ATP-dependent carboligase